MGAYRNNTVSSVVRRVLALFLLLVTGLIYPWMLTLVLAGALLAFRIISFEVIFVGGVLDAILVSAQNGLFDGFFFTLIFIAFFVIAELTSAYFRNNE